MTAYEVLDVALSALSFATLAFVLVQVVSHSRQMHHDFEAMYLQRFWSIMERRSMHVNFEASPRWLAGRDRRVIEDYLALSNDQVALRRLGRITDETWLMWAPDIVGFTSQRAIALTLWKSSPLAYPDLRALLSNATADPAWDPCSLGPVRRWIRGL